MIDFIFQLCKLALSIKHNSLIAKIYIEFEQVLSSQIINVSLIPFNLVLDAYNFLIASPIQSLPEHLNLMNPVLVSYVS